MKSMETFAEQGAAASSRAGQSLVEILVAIAIGVIILVAAVTVIAPALRTNTSVERTRAAAALGKELLENVRVVSERDWNVIADLATTSANQYYVDDASSPFSIASGIETVSVGTTTYTRYFYLQDVYRNSSGKVDEGVTGTLLDPSARKIVVAYAWPGNGSSTMTSYLFRWRSRPYFQTDWSGGGNASGPITATSVTNRFASSSGIDFSTTTGSIRIQGL